jgi:DUF1680 family protein
MPSSTTNSINHPANPSGLQGRPLFTPVPFTRVTIEDTFWAPKLQVNRERTIPHIYQQCLETGRIDAFSPDWQPGPEITALKPWGGTPVMFWDSDVAKWLEAASYSLATHFDPQFDALVDEVIAIITQAQHTDGYLNTWFTTVDPQNRWKNLRDWHELYCAGHLIEAGVAHYQATDKRTLLDVVCRYADYIASVFGVEPDQKRGYPGHPEIELALVKLYRATGERRYLELSRYFVDERGRKPPYFDQEAQERGDDPATFWASTYEYNQSHRPVREQQEVVGHAVRAMYLYSAMMDLAYEYGDASLHEVCEHLWPHLTTKRMYVTGGIGTSDQNEGFTNDYDLPNESAYAETCAAIGLIFWAQRLLRLDCDRRYADILELALYNSVLSAISSDGQHFFYENPLASNGHHHRQTWFFCPCCPPNLARLFGSLGEYIYAQSETDAVVHLYIQGTGRLSVGDQTITLRQDTNYPWEGTVTIQVTPKQPATFGLRLRIPGWCRSASVQVNGQAVDLTEQMEQGYVRVERLWQSGDVIKLGLAIPIEQLSAHPEVQVDQGHITLQRGPLIYCLEQCDHAEPLHRLVLPSTTALTSQVEPDLLGGVVVLRGTAAALVDTDWEDTLYRPHPPATRPVPITAIPYYAWGNREPGPMRVWLRIYNSN